MKPEILVSTGRLARLISAGDCLVVDCRFDLSDVNKGRKDWLAGHIPGAHYAHLGDDLSAQATARSGRHPLPESEAFAVFLASLGWVEGQLVVACDSGSNAISGRLWWLMRYFGQPAALLDGGMAAWNEAGLPLQTGPVEAQPAVVPNLRADLTMTVSTKRIVENLETMDLTVLDARAPERFSGVLETLDAKAGHIPGAVNRNMQLNLESNGRFKDPASLRSEFEARLGDASAESVAHSCGSGVTACHNLFAMELAGMGRGLLYPGSWSEWIQDPSRPVETDA
jgi:thiosulfate/3-mercaptopyruvate sulfurtransferase